MKDSLEHCRNGSERSCGSLPRRSVRCATFPKYHISEADLRYFAERVELLMSETESRCKAFLETLPKALPAHS
jgi:hypothetical protein